MVWLRRAESTFAFRKVVEAGSAREPLLAESRDRLPALGRTRGNRSDPHAVCVRRLRGQRRGIGAGPSLHLAGREGVERVGRCAQCADGDAASFERESADPSLPDRVSPAEFPSAGLALSAAGTMAVPPQGRRYWPPWDLP